MRTMISKLLFTKAGHIPFEWRICWPVNPDDEYLIVFVQWEQHEEWEVFPLRIELHGPALARQEKLMNNCPECLPSNLTVHGEKLLRAVVETAHEVIESIELDQATGERTPTDESIKALRETLNAVQPNQEQKHD